MKYYIAIDANETGKILEKYLFSGDLNGLRTFSERMKQTIANMDEYLKSKDCSVFMAGGDNVMAEINENNVLEIIEYIKDINQTQKLRFSVGIGGNSAQSYLALKYAKVNGIFAVKFLGDKFEEV